ncbi:MAG: glutamate synthase large subunit, partial [Deltaproteobacteria bacterium]|nr:glutamate synthase large subunit [Deltaproteobacteria bacterium]
VTLPGPVLTNGQIARLKAVTGQGLFEARTLSTQYPRDGHLDVAVDSLCDAAVAAVDDGINILVLSDRGVDAERLAIPSLLALSAVHQRLVREGIRTHTGLVVEAADVREVHHVACLIGFGAAAVNPWLALDTLRDLAERGLVDAGGEHQARYLKALHEGLLKVMSKMGISTLQSYRGAQIFEAVGLDSDVVARHFTGTPCRIGGVSLATWHDENRARHDRGFRAPPAPPALAQLLPTGGLYAFRKDGEMHRWSPQVVHALQKAARAGDDAALWEHYRVLADGDEGAPTVLRGLLRLRTDACTPVPLDEVESADAIVRRFSSGAMSLGALSPEAHEMLAVAMNRLGARSNSGEGGEEPHRDVVDVVDEPTRGTRVGDSRRSAIRQVASGRFGVTVGYLVNATELQVKMAQGAKPGEGGQLPGQKVDERVARVRHSTPGVTLISPPPHHDIYSIEDLKQLIWDLQSVNPTARVSVKLVAEVGVGTVAAGVVKAGAGGVTVSGWEGGTGAAPLSSLKHAGLPWELGIAEAQQVLVQMGLRDRARLQVDGGLRTGRDVVIAALLGAEEMGLATGALIAGGCVMMRKCHLNTCGVGVATQDPALRRKFPGRPEHVVAYFRFVAEDVRRIMASLGVRRFDELVGHVELLARRDDAAGLKARALDLSRLLVAPAAPAGPARRGGDRRVDLGAHLDHALVERARAVVDGDDAGARVVIDAVVRNTDRAVGTLLSGTVARRRGPRLSDGAIDVRLSGAAGQSLGAFLAPGVALALRGEANDGVAKGLSGGRVVVMPPAESTLVREDNVIVGNVALYGATAGELFVSGVAGERFAVRNSGARAVVEGCGDHGCEYMTGGVVVVLGDVGRNFAAGMSGGLAFVLDRARTFARRCNVHGIELLTLDDGDAWLVQGLVQRHVELTGSPLGARVLAAWELLRPQFVKVLPVEYKRAIESRREQARAAATANAAP